MSETLTYFEDLPEDVRKGLADINAHANILLAYLNGSMADAKKDNSKYHALEIYNTCQELLKSKEQKNG